MRVLHTADWHLGKRFETMEMAAEHQYFLDWLIETISIHQINLLIIAGDIFDSGTPPNTALKQYYDFLWKVRATCCGSVVIIGGNHDSVSTLNAPQDLLRHLNIHVVGGVPEIFDDQVIPIDNNGKTELVVCAVPFLRDKDVRISMPGETNSEREGRLKKGIADHYKNLVPLISHYKAQHIPVIVTGHLYAAGAKSSESEREIHAGTLGQIGSEDFPEEFNYIALGHLHRAQLVNKKKHIRYPGAPVALGFSEADTPKMVLVLDFENGELTAVSEIEIPIWRQLLRIKGNADMVKKEFLRLEEIPKPLKAWVEIIIEVEKAIPDIYAQLDQILKSKPFIERYVPKQVLINKKKITDGEVLESLSLIDWDPKSVFKKWCEEENPGNQEEIDELTNIFNEALEKMYQDVKKEELTAQPVRE